MYDKILVFSKYVFWNSLLANTYFEKKLYFFAIIRLFFALNLNSSLWNT